MSTWLESTEGLLPFGNTLLVLALVLGGLGLWLRVSLGDRPTAYFSRLLGLLALVLLGLWLPRFGGWAEQAVFWLLAGVAVLTAGTAISTRSPVYTAIWFALSLLATAGLFLFLGAQFLGFATITIYAGAIVVMFLFVLMLAQPQGFAVYDRVTWSWFSAPLGLFAGGVLLGVLLITLSHGFSPDNVVTAPTEQSRLVESHHVASLGGELFARHLVEVEIVGAILLAALVGAIAIVIHGRSSPAATVARPRPRVGGQSSSLPPLPGGPPA